MVGHLIDKVLYQQNVHPNQSYLASLIIHLLASLQIQLIPQNHYKTV